MATPISELRLGPKRTERDLEIALEELQEKVNELIRKLNEIEKRIAAL